MTITQIPIKPYICGLRNETKTFAGELIDFYGMGRGTKPAKVYYAGLSMHPTKESYERELDELIAGICLELDNPFAIKKIGLTLSKEIAAKRPDIETIVGDLNEMYFDGVLFLPRPAVWIRENSLRNADNTPFYSSLSSLIQRTNFGLIAFNLEEDHSDEQINGLAAYIHSKAKCCAEIIYSPEWLSKTHILAKHKG